MESYDATSSPEEQRAYSTGYREALLWAADVSHDGVKREYEEQTIGLPQPEYTQHQISWHRRMIAEKLRKKEAGDGEL